MKMMAAGVFKSKCLAVMDEVKSTRRSVLITKRGRPVAKLVPVATEQDDPIFGFFVGRGRIVGDVSGPASDDWSSLK